MKKAEYIARPILQCAILIIIIDTIILLCFKEFWGALLGFCFAILLAIPLIVFRKFFFKKMLLNETGAYLSYRDKILRAVKWEDVKEIQYRSGIFTLSDKPLYTGKEKYKNTFEINILTNSKFIIEFYKYAYKIPVPIKEINKMPEYVKNGINKYKNQNQTKD